MATRKNALHFRSWIMPARQFKRVRVKTPFNYFDFKFGSIILVCACVELKHGSAVYKLRSAAALLPDAVPLPLPHFDPVQACVQAQCPC